jgi:hypothetical protein
MANFWRRSGQLKPVSCKPFPLSFNSTTSMQIPHVVADESCVTCCIVFAGTDVASACSHVSVRQVMSHFCACCVF